MAGGFLSKQNQTKPNFVKKEFEAEPQVADKSPKKVTGLRGILGLGQSVEISKQPKSSWGQEFIITTNHLVEDHKRILETQQKELENVINELRKEIKDLSVLASDATQEVSKAVFDPIIETGEYHLNFLIRLKKLVISLRQSVVDTTLWLESFKDRKKKRNAFWGKVKSKKGGEQYLFSSEHSTARSVN